MLRMSEFLSICSSHDASSDDFPPQVSTVEELNSDQPMKYLWEEGLLHMKPSRIAKLFQRNTE